MKISRHQFIKIAANSALFSLVFLAVGKLPVGKASGELLRPPGAVKEEYFLASCNRCGLCVDVCRRRTGVIRALTLAAGFQNAGLPQFSSPDSYCNRCLDCCRACPTGALREVPSERLGVGTARIIKEKCVRYRGEECTDECVWRCVNTATKIVNGVPVVQDDICDGAGYCVVSCPHGARYVEVDPKKRQPWKVNGTRI